MNEFFFLHTFTDYVWKIVETTRHFEFDKFSSWYNKIQFTNTILFKILAAAGIL